MLIKLLFSCLLLLCSIGFIARNSTWASTSSVINFNLEITDAEKLLVCCEVADQKVLELNTALAMLKDGSLSITKIDSGVYRVNYPGGSIVILVADNI